MALKSISYGGGVQSTALLVLAATYDIDYPLFLFANVGERSEHVLRAFSARETVLKSLDLLPHERKVLSEPVAARCEKAEALVERAADDGVLAEKVGRRTDIPPRLFRTLLMQATAVVQQRLLAKARPETAAEIRRVLVVGGPQSAERAIASLSRRTSASNCAGWQGVRGLRSSWCCSRPR